MIRSLLPLNRVLLAIVLTLGVLLAVLDSGGVAQRAVEPLLPTFDGARATSIRIVKPAQRGASDATTVTIGRATLDEAWRVAELHQGFAAPLLIEGLLARIGAMTTLDLVSEDPDRIDEYELGEDDALRITVESAASGPAESSSGDDREHESGLEVTAPRLLADVFVARGPGAAAFVRRAGEASVYRIARLPMPPTEPFGWFDRRSLVPLENVQIARLVARGRALGQGEVVIEQPLSEFGSFRDSAGKDISREQVLDLLQRLRSLFPVEVLGREESGELDPDTVSFEVEIEPRTGNVFRIVFGPVDESPGAGLVPSVSAMGPGDDLVVGCDGRAVLGVLQALRALGR